ncbi:MAG: branched-chain amino acid ABC transporter permease [Termitinemataceae bacterium]|nr:MAG: branched-chain amino acid ABC transporter permease [Termitinemataceae bacterium]
MLFQQLINGISVGGIYALIASGYALIYSLLGFSNWAHGEVAMVGAYIAWLSMAMIKLPFPLALIFGIAGAALLSVINERFFYRPIRERRSPAVFLMIAAMGLSIIFQNGSMLIFGAKFHRYEILLPITSIPIFGARIGAVDLASLIVSAISLLALDTLITKTKFGLGVRAIASNGRTASLLGINVDRIFMLVFMLAGMLAGLAGILLGFKYNVYPTMGNIGLKAFIASVFGGLGSVRGAIIGALTIGIIESLVTGYWDSGLRDFITFALLIAILLIKPSGLMGINVEEKA